MVVDMAVTRRSSAPRLVQDEGLYKMAPEQQEQVAEVSGRVEIEIGVGVEVGVAIAVLVVIGEDSEGLPSQVLAPRVWLLLVAPAWVSCERRQ
jgi:hypothetical protein